MANTPARGPFRIPDSEWAPARERANREGVSLTDVVRRALREYVASPEVDTAERGDD